jgi:hypothetical protein
MGVSSNRFLRHAMTFAGLDGTAPEENIVLREKVGLKTNASIVNVFERNFFLNSPIL